MFNVSFMTNNKNLDDVYADLVKGITIVEDSSYKNLVNFNENKQLPKHNWFYIKEGYSKALVNKFVDKYHLKNGNLVFDPFCGSGTTLLASKERNIESIGVEINPFLAFLSKVKLENYNCNDRKNILKELRRINSKKNRKGLVPPELSISKKLFPYNLDIILNLRQNISDIKDTKSKDILKLGFLSVLEDCSIAKKDGNGLKYPKNKDVKDIKQEFNNKIIQMLKDISLENKTKFKVYNINSINSQNELKLYFNKVDLTIFSPPYLNCFDYTEVYKMELWFGDFVKDYSDLKSIRNETVSSHLNKNMTSIKNSDNRISQIITQISKKKLWNNKISAMIDNYFNDLESVLKTIYKLSSKNAKCVIVVGNSAYNETVIPTDLLLANIGRKIGFNKVKIIIARKLGTSSQQYKNVNAPNLLRESIIILEK